MISERATVSIVTNQVSALALHEPKAPINHVSRHVGSMLVASPW